MSNTKAVRQAIAKQAGVTLRESLRAEQVNWIREQLGTTKPNVCFTCKSCWRRSLQSDLNRLQCPFCGGSMVEGTKP